MAQARHIGKVVITLPPMAPQHPQIQSDATYLITGGLGALGLQLAQWLITQGARHLALLGRSTPSDHAQHIIHTLEQTGATIHCLQADVANFNELQDTLTPFLKAGNPIQNISYGDAQCFLDAEGDTKLSSAPTSQRTNTSTSQRPSKIQNPKSKIQNPSSPQLKGIFHLAGVLDDGLLLNQTWERTAAVMAPKLTGAWNVHQLTQNLSLDHFVCFSSIASLIGSPGQGIMLRPMPSWMPSSTIVVAWDCQG